MNLVSVVQEKNTSAAVALYNVSKKNLKLKPKKLQSQFLNR